MPPKVKVGQRQREAAVPRGAERSRLYQAIGRLQTQLAQVRAFAAPLLTPMQFAMRYNAQAAGPEGREELIIYLYQGDYSNATLEASQWNPELSNMLVRLTDSNYQPGEQQAAAFALSKLKQVDFISGVIARCRNKDLFPIMQIAFGVLMIHRPGADLFLDYFAPSRVLPSASWLRDLVLDAQALWPGPPYECISYVTAVVLDNYEEHSSYKASHTSATQGERLAMTNMLTVYLPLRTGIDPSSGVAFNFHNLVATR